MKNSIFNETENYEELNYKELNWKFPFIVNYEVVLKDDSIVPLLPRPKTLKDLWIIIHAMSSVVGIDPLAKIPKIDDVDNFVSYLSRGGEITHKQLESMRMLASSEGSPGDLKITSILRNTRSPYSLFKNKTGFYNQKVRGKAIQLYLDFLYNYHFIELERIYKRLFRNLNHKFVIDIIKHLSKEQIEEYNKLWNHNVMTKSFEIVKNELKKEDERKNPLNW